MSVKTTIEALITAIQDGQLNTSSELRATYTAILNEMFAESILDSSTTQNQTTRSTANLSYIMRLRKVGTSINVSLSFTSNLAVVGNPQYLFTWKPTDYKPRNVGFKVQAFNSLNLSNWVILRFDDTGCYIMNQFYGTPNGTYECNITLEAQP
jgi:hypothetical protein